MATQNHNQTSSNQNRRWNPATQNASKLKDTSEELEAEGEVPEDATTEERKPRQRKVIDFGKASFKVDQRSVDEIFNSIKDRQESTGEGTPARDLAAAFCGDEKFAPVIAFVVGKYLANDIEAVQGIGYCVKGMPRKEERVDVSPQVLHAMEKILTDALAKVPPGGRGISEEKLVLLAATKGIIKASPDGSLSDAEVRAAIRQLMETGRYEQARGSGIRLATPKQPAQEG